VQEPGLEEKLTSMPQNQISQATFRELIYQVCKRPKMYVGKYSFDMVAAFLEGFVYALRSEGVKDFFEDFSIFLGKKYKHPTNYGWPFILREAYPDDETLFEMLPRLYDEYLVQRETKPSSNLK
jgi:hypothetical protein